MNITENDVLEKLKSRGYWLIEIHPDEYQKDKFSLNQCREIIEKSQVRLRGWYYPHFGYNGGDYFNGQNFVESYVDHGTHCECWRMYQSGQFVHYLNFWEDWISYAPYGYNIMFRDVQRPNVKEVLMTLYTITEIYLFASRLAGNEIIDKIGHLSITLKNTNNRMMIFGDQFRTLHGNYICKIDEIRVERNMSLENILADPASMALDTTFEIFERFNWQLSKDTKDILKKDQEKFLKGLI